MNSPPVHPTAVDPGHDDRLPRAMSAGSAVMAECANAVTRALDRFDTFEAAVSLLLFAKGRVVVTGLGKSGHIAAKLAATFASTGTPAFFVHAGDALHNRKSVV